MALQTCDKHKTSDDETAIVVYESYSRSYAVAKCPMCEAVEELARIKDRAHEPEYNEQAMGCGLEDRDITDRYAAMEYGWERAMERVYSDVIG
jgi:hypothetical protein